ncbi:acetate/propionate family kinase [Zeaxanthinibacter enoshimensis]|uniref:Acetate kinase n=1 Tax=Zeaxanthinibacter enoshimensis TaxID=392009 RepID=A0A4R6TRF3_9FLAO|nr:acetate kinase [Zeaxanthinibacter enoshimensis]TDQ31070.1 acetate kinase [Zeaxanthinibacter enoshimensis]
MKILILNSGSSSIKYKLMQMPTETVICEGLIERIGSADAVFRYSSKKADITESRKISSHNEGLELIARYLAEGETAVIQDVGEIDAVGHRVVHGGNTFTDTTLITEAVKSKVRELSNLAPLHNPHNLEGINLAEKLFPSAKQVAVFDTAFHQTIPPRSKKYALPRQWSSEYGIEVYGFHGTSHKYVAAKANEYLRKNRSRIVTIHLGNGCSMTAVKDGKSVEHSMGFTPSNGLIMGTRSGDIDPFIIFHLVFNLGYELETVRHQLLKESGMKGLTGYTDLRDIQSKAADGKQECILALEMNAHRIKKYIGSYAAIMNGLDAIVFTAGIGENSAVLRELVCRDMQFLGIELDQARNRQKSSDIREINSPRSQVKVLVIPTEEELEIATQTYKLCKE